MLFDCPRKELADAINMANAASSTRTTLPIYTNLKIEANDNGVRIVGSDQELWAERTVSCIITTPGTVCLNSKLLSDIVNSLSDGDVRIDFSSGTTAEISQGESMYKLQTMDPFDFAEPPSIPEENTISLPMGTLRKAIDEVSIAVSADPHRQVLTGVLFSTDGEKLVLVATDTHRLCVSKVSTKGSVASFNVIVPEKALKLIKALPLSDESTIELKFGNSQIGVEANGAKVVAQLLQGQFPNWQRVVPSECTRTWQLEIEELTDKVRRTMIVARDSASRLKFSGDGDQLTISAKSEERGEGKETVPMVATNGDMAIAFNGKYIQDLLGVIDSKGLKIEMTESTRAALFKPADDDQDYFCVIMPMQL